MGGNLGGIAGADAKCQSLAAAAGQGSKTWHAYLSTSAAPAVNARTRIGSGPWFNARGVMIAASVAQLHDEGGMNALSATNSLDQNGAAVPNNQHDMLTGSTVAGMAFPATPDRTCADWTSNATTGVTGQVGHANRAGGGDIPTSWNSAHATPNCSQASIMGVGGAGRFYCFAIN